MPVRYKLLYITGEEGERCFLDIMSCHNQLKSNNWKLIQISMKREPKISLTN